MPTRGSIWTLSSTSGVQVSVFSISVCTYVCSVRGEDSIRQFSIKGTTLTVVVTVLAKLLQGFTGW